MTQIIVDIVSQHVEEAAFLWSLRDAVVYAPNYSLEELVDFDDRIEAHLDGLRIAGDAGWELCRELLAWEEAGEIFTASVIALESGLSERCDVVLEAATTSETKARGLISALGWLPYTRAQPYIHRLLAAESTALRRIGIGGAAIHRQDPGSYLQSALAEEDPPLRTRAIKAAGELGRRDLLTAVMQQTQAEDEACRFCAAWSAARLGNPHASLLLYQIAEQGGPYAERAGVMALRTMHLSEAHAWQRKLAERADHDRLAFIGAGVIGDPVLVPWLIENMSIPERARIAGDAFAMITGVDITYENLEGEWPEGFEAGPTEDPEDEDVDMDADEDLPWPESNKIRTWWNTHQEDFRPGTRYLLGQPISEGTLAHALRNGQQRQRAAAALERGIQQPDHPLFEVRAPGLRQQRILDRP